MSHEAAGNAELHGKPSGEEHNSAEDAGEEEQSFTEGKLDEQEVGQRKPHVPRAPFKVTLEEREAHEVTHTPFRAWCRYCVLGRARNSPHRQREDAAKRSGVPKIAMDYFFMSNADEAASRNPLCVMVDEGTGERYARALGQKGPGSQG